MGQHGRDGGEEPDDQAAATSYLLFVVPLEHPAAAQMKVHHNGQNL